MKMLQVSHEGLEREAFLEIGNANGSKRLPINLGTTTNNIAECALVFFNDS